MSRQPFGPLSAVAGVVIFGCGAFFAAFPFAIAPLYAAMFAEFGSADALPVVSKLVMKPITSAAALVFLTGGALAGISRPRERALVLSLTAGGGIALVLLAMASLYLPLIGLAAQLSP